MARRLPTWLTRAERKRLLAADMSDRDRAVVSVFLFAGLRSNELRMLDIEDVDFEAMTILVRHGKRAKQRVVPLHAEAAAAMDQYLGDRQAGPLFLNRFGQRLSNRWLRTMVKALGRQAGIRKELHPHALRHTFAVSIREAGEELDVLKDLLGHASIETTEIYTHCSVDQLRSAVDKI